LIDFRKHSQRKLPNSKGWWHYIPKQSGAGRISRKGIRADQRDSLLNNHPQEIFCQFHDEPKSNTIYKPQQFK